MNISAEQLAELLAGIAKSQNAIIDAVERANGGWRNTHMSPMLTVAANMRSAEPRLVDLPARILMRYQGRPAVDIATIAGELERLVSGAPAAATPVDASAAMARPAAIYTRPAARPPAAAPAPAAPAPAEAGDDLNFSKGA